MNNSHQGQTIISCHIIKIKVFKFNLLSDVFSSIVTYRWHNGRIENIDYSPSRSDREDKRDLQIFEADFLCNVMEIT